MRNGQYSEGFRERAVQMMMAADCQMAIDLVAEAIAAGARRFKVCAVLGIDARTLQRWPGDTRNRNPVIKVWLNPPQENQPKKGQNLKAE